MHQTIYFNIMFSTSQFLKASLNYLPVKELSSLNNLMKDSEAILFCLRFTSISIYINLSSPDCFIMHPPRGSVVVALVFSRKFSVWILKLHILQVIKVSCSLFQLLQITTGYYRLLKLLQVTTGYYRSSVSHCFFFSLSLCFQFLTVFSVFM